jgi:hypothetical protein
MIELAFGSLHLEAGSLILDFEIIFWFAWSLEFAVSETAGLDFEIGHLFYLNCQSLVVSIYVH